MTKMDTMNDLHLPLTFGRYRYIPRRGTRAYSDALVLIDEWLESGAQNARDRLHARLTAAVADGDAVRINLDYSEQLTVEAVASDAA